MIRDAEEELSAGGAPASVRADRPSPKEESKKEEAEAIKAKLRDKDYVVALDIAGTGVSTELIAKCFDRWQMQGDQVSIVIGGPDGLHPQILKGAKERWSLGQITLPHPLVRVILAEQMYRAWSVQTGHPYHRV